MKKADRGFDYSVRYLPESPSNKKHLFIAKQPSTISLAIDDSQREIKLQITNFRYVWKPQSGSHRQNVERKQLWKIRLLPE
jgi:hypothetical protein